MEGGRRLNSAVSSSHRCAARSTRRCAGTRDAIARLKERLQAADNFHKKRVATLTAPATLLL